MSCISFDSAAIAMQAQHITLDPTINSDAITRARQIAFEIQQTQDACSAQPHFIPNHPNKGLARPLMITTDQAYMLFTKHRMQQDSLLGQGSFKTVKYALNLYSGELKAIAILKQRKHNCLPVPHDKWARQIHATSCELQTMARFSNQPHLAQADASCLVDRGRKGEKYYILMPCYKGGSLRHALSRPFSIEEKLRIAEGIALGVSTLHAHGIVHRDLKTENVFFEDTSYKTVRLGDFGFTCSISDLSRLGTPQGTPKSLSPELAKCLLDRLQSNHKQTQEERALKWASLPVEAADNWALGTLLFELFSNTTCSFAETFTLIHERRKHPHFRASLDANVRYYLRLNTPNNQILIDETIDTYCTSQEIAPILKKLLRHNAEERLSSADTAQTLKELCLHSTHSEPSITPEILPAPQNKEVVSLQTEAFQYAGVVAKEALPY